ncbi:MAG: ABC-type transport auxiliary lipoprotein family protein [Gammaproteobacteria bacterium]|nr:ABC-type transport auxiliary lipoprotein family protein [Gammaproteobacteria bacterium]
MKRLTFLIFLSVLISACGSILPSGPAPDLFYLTPKSTFSDQLPKVSWQLVIEEPVAGGGLDTSSIAMHPNPTEVKYFADARWTERAPKMIQTLLVESFENSGTITAVGREAIGLRADYSLKTELREFQAEYFSGTESAPSVRVRINAKIIKQPRQIIVASRNFEHVFKVNGNTEMLSIIKVFDSALGKVMKDLVEWTLVSTEAVENAESS